MIKIVVKTEFFSANMIAIRQLVSYHQGGVWVPPVAPWTLLCGLLWTDSRSKQCSGKGPTKVHADPWRSLERVHLDLVGFSLSSVNGLFLKVICLSGYSIKPFTVHPSRLVCAVYSWSVYREKDRRSATQSWGESKRAQGLNHRTFLPVPSSPKELSHKQ